MKSNNLNESRQQQGESVSLASRVLLVIFCLAAGLGYRIIVGLIPPSIVQLGVLLVLSVVFLLLAVFTKRDQNLSKYWEIPLAFFIFTIAGILGDSNSFASLQQMFVMNVLHEAPTASNPIASTVMGTVLGQAVGTIGLVAPIILLTKASGNDLKSIFLDKSRNRWALIFGIVGFVVLYLYTASGRAQRFFPNAAVPFSHYIALTPALIILALCNGLREELWFRGLFLKKYLKFLGSFSSNLLSAFIFAAFHVAVTYSWNLPLFLVIALVQGLILGYLMQKSSSLLASVLFHAGLDIPIFLVYLSYISK
ncbi:MAG: CPBP family intramembrane glutamic endopeptidase [Anaerolineales bacterium]